MQKKAIIIGSGFAGISAASFLAKAGWNVTVLEKHHIPGGRARKMEVNGYVFDMGPSWYWMPDVFERYFQQFGKKTSDYYELKRLDPSYRVYFEHDVLDVPASYDALKLLFEKIEPGSAAMLDHFMTEAAYKYEVGIHKLVHQPGQSITEFVDLDFIRGVLRLDVFTSIKSHVQKHFKDSKLRQLMEFPVLFLGALPQKTPALYSLMNYADIKLGTWYPLGGMYKVVEAMCKLAEELGVKFLYEHDVEKIETINGIASGVFSNGNYFDADVIVSGADYHFTETKLLPEAERSYSDYYWEKRTMAPSALLYYVGINKKIKQLPHHSLFFDTSFEQHGKEIYTSPQWPANPLFYVSMASATDDAVAPDGHENFVFLIPVAAGLKNDNEQLREKYFKQIIQRFEARIGEPISNHIVYKRSYAISDFVTDYNAFKGNAYGLANTLLQTSVLKPSCRSKKISNLYYTGQLTVPGPGVPPSLISGEVVATLIEKQYTTSTKNKVKV